MSTMPCFPAHSPTSPLSASEKSILGRSVRRLGSYSGSLWLPGIMRRQPFRVVLSSMASHTVRAFIGASFQYAPSWCHSTGWPS